jgi:hypothetical protein
MNAAPVGRFVDWGYANLSVCIAQVPEYRS